MTFIKTLPPAMATGLLAEVYQDIAGKRGEVGAVLQAHSLNPAALQKHFELYKQLLFGRSDLDRRTREMIGVVVSAANRCDYCVAHHSTPLHAYKVDSEVIERLRSGEIPADLLNSSLVKLLEFAKASTLSPAQDEDAIRALRDEGWSDEAILDATLVSSYFNFVNRVVLALGVDLEENYEESCSPELSESRL